MGCNSQLQVTYSRMLDSDGCATMYGGGFFWIFWYSRVSCSTVSCKIRGWQLLGKNLTHALESRFSRHPSSSFGLLQWALQPRHGREGKSRGRKEESKSRGH